MSIVLDETTFFGFTHSVGYTGQYTGSFGNQDFTSYFLSNPYLPFPKTVDFNTTSNITTGFHQYFKLEGFNPITQKYETWHCRDIPLFAPPSGNTLQNIVVVTSWIDR